MRKISKDSFLFIVLLLVLSFLGCKGDKHKPGGTEATKYTCPMHPQIIKDAAGSCPICKMDLVPLEGLNAHAGVNDSLALLIKPTDELVLSNIKTTSPQQGSRFAELSVRGVINYNTSKLNSVSARVAGRIERLYVKYSYQLVSKGQKLMDIYSPDLAAAQQELLFLKNNNETRLLESAKRKLRILGASERQINQILKTGKVDYTISIYSPYSGYVSEVQNSATTSPNTAAGSTMITSETSGTASSMGDMAGSGAASASTSVPVPNLALNSPLQLREGLYISVGQRLFSLVNPDAVWAEFYVNPEQLQIFKRGTMVQVRSVDVPSKRTRVPITLIQPYYSDGETFSLIRATIPNPNHLWKVGELITVAIRSTRNIGSWLPKTAVLQLGTKHVSFVKNRRRAFVPVYVKVNRINGDWVDIGNSLAGDQEVAVNAWFLVDSESFIKVKSVAAE